jgi:hypothetical protein
VESAGSRRAAVPRSTAVGAGKDRRNGTAAADSGALPGATAQAIGMTTIADELEGLRETTRQRPVARWAT